MARSTRRECVRAGVGLLGAGVLGSVAGCRSFLGRQGGGPGGADGGGDERAAWADWLPEQGTANVQLPSMAFADVAALARHESTIGDGYERFTAGFGRHEQFGLDTADVGRRITASSYRTMLTADVDRSAAAGALTANGYRRTGEDQGFAVYRHEERRVAAGVGDGELVSVSDPADPVAVVDALVGAKRGTVERVAAANDDARALFDAVGSPTAFRGGLPGQAETDTFAERGYFEGTVAWGWSLRLRDGQTDLRAVRVFEEADDVDRDALETWAETERFGAASSTAVVSDGRVAWVEGSMPTETLGRGGWGLYPG